MIFNHWIQGISMTFRHLIQGLSSFFGTELKAFRERLVTGLFRTEFKAFRHWIQGLLGTAHKEL